MPHRARAYPEPWSVVRLGPQDWRSYRDLRLAMLLDAPEAFATTHAEVVDRPDQQWRAACGGTVPVVQVRAADGAELGTLTVLPVDTASPAEGLELGDALVVAVWVRPEVRGRGVGQLLMGEAERVGVGELGARRLVLHVNEENDPALRLYRSRGFRPTGAWIPHPRLAGVKELVLAKALNHGG